VRIKSFWSVACRGVVGSHLVGQFLWRAVKEFTVIAELASMGDVVFADCKKIIVLVTRKFISML
jgi:hypothetical protein